MILPEDFYKLAIKLFSDPNASEEHYRTAISRAYYAVYHAWSKFAQSKDEKIVELISKGHWIHHGELRDWIIKHYGELGSDIDTLLNHRIKADYRIETNITPEEAGVALKSAAKLLDYLKGVS